MDEGHLKNSWPSAKPVYADYKEIGQNLKQRSLAYEKIRTVQMQI